MIRSTTLALTLSVAAASLAACGGSGAQSRAEDDARAAYERLLRAVADSDGERACAALTARARKQLTTEVGIDEDECVNEINMTGLLLGDEATSALRRPDIRKVSVRGDRAEIHDRDVEFPAPMTREDNDRPTVLRRVRGRWMIEDLG